MEWIDKSCPNLAQETRLVNLGPRDKIGKSCPKGQDFPILSLGPRFTNLVPRAKIYQSCPLG